MDASTCQEWHFSAGGKTIDLFSDGEDGRPLVYLNTFSGEGEKVWENLLEAGCRDFSLAAVSGLEWDHDMSPWAIPPIAEGDAPCTGGADGYLALLLGEIAPECEGRLGGTPSWRGLAGYSLGGLFALYAAFKTDRFTRIGSMSGSLWFPGFLDYAFDHEMAVLPSCVYLSLGEEEHLAKNEFLQPVLENTGALEEFFAAKGIDTAFELNPGNHFQDPIGRTAQGIRWMLGR